nr:unnamed protein product [Callosobruchus analis]
MAGINFRGPVHIWWGEWDSVHICQTVSNRISRRPFTRTVLIYTLRRSTPIPSLLFTCVTSLLMLTISDVIELINYYGQVLWLTTAAAIAGQLWLRHKQPNLHRPIRVHTALPVTFLLCCVFLVLFPVPRQPGKTAIGLAITASGIPVYYLCVKWKNKPQGYHRLLQKITIFTQKLMEVTYPQATELLS